MMHQVIKFRTLVEYNFGDGPSYEHEVGVGKLDGAGFGSGAVYCWSEDFEFCRVIPLSRCDWVDILAGVLTKVP